MMNELLTKIATEAKVEHCISHVRLQSFAELIVKETISKMSQQLDAHGDNQANNPAYYKAIEDSLKYFGVEE
jgi:hypothetical protein